MRVPIKPICEKKMSRKDGTSFIYFQYCYSWDPDLKTLLNTQIAIPATFWDKKKLCIKEQLPKENIPIKFGCVAKMNDELDRQERLVCDLIKLVKDQGISEIGPYVKERFSPDLELEQFAMQEFNLKFYQVPEAKKKKEGFFKHLEEYVDIKKKKGAPGSATVYDSVVLHLEGFEKHRGQPITFNTLDFSFYEDFVDFLTYDYVIPRRRKELRGLRLNSIGKTIKNLRMFIKDRVKRRVIPPIDLTDYKIPEEESDAIYLSYDEIGKIYNLDLTEHPGLIIYRDLFVLACLTGLRFSDFSALEPEDLHQDMLYKKQQKSVHWVVIPMRKEAKEIFTKQFKEKIPSISDVKFNEIIKVLGKMAGICQAVKFSYKKGNKLIEEKKPKYAWITSHTARRSFCTNEFLKGTPVLLIMKISGHKREKDFYRYIRIDPREAAERVKTLWMERDEFEVFKNPLKRAINMQSV